MNLNPFFCLKCAEIRGADIGTGTLLIKNEELYYRSFDMCPLCKSYIDTHSQEEIEQNRKKYQEKVSKQYENKNTENIEFII